MSISKRFFAATACAVGAALLVAACGGGGGTIAPKANISRVFVMGDSIADVGTFGFKFTVQNSASALGFPIWTQVIATNYGVAAAQCNFYRFTGTTFIPNPTAGCSNYAVGGGRIFNPTSNGGAAAPFDIKTQLATAAQVNGTYKEGDLILVDGGGNDFADLVGAYLGAGSATGAAAFQAFLLQQLTPSELGAIFAGNPAASAPAVAAGAYATKLADTYYNAVKANTLDKGANRVAVLNAPDILLTPRFQAVLAGLTAQAGAATSAAVAGATRGWINAFNNQLRTRVAGDARIALVDFYTDFTDQVQNPSSYGLVNATAAVCPVVGADSSGLPAYDFPTCSSTALNARAPAGMGAGWYDQYAFSDGFHPTPYGHKLLAASVSRALARAGFL